MQTWAQILAKSAALLNDQVRAVYTDTVLLPYLNISLTELQELFELNNIPVTNEESAVITVPAGDTVVAFDAAPAPELPDDLVEIQRLFESQVGQNNWIPMVRKEFLTGSSIIGNAPVAMFGIWAWINQEIRLLPSNRDNDLKIDYIQSLFVELALGDLTNDNNIRNTDNFLQYRVAALAAEFIDENFTRAQSLNSNAGMSLDRSLGTSVKGKQAITTRRRPFRASFKRRRVMM